MEEGFVRGQSDNLPKIDSFTMASFFATNSNFVSAEIRGSKALRSARDSYGDNAIGYVQVKREGHLCTVKARITPEHKVGQTPYHVNLICDENESIVQSVECHGCAASAGGCKHSIAFLSWLHRRSEEPAPTSVQCYWSKPKLSSIGTSIKFIKIKDIAKTTSTSASDTSDTTDGSFLTAIMEKAKENKLELQLSKFFYDPSVCITVSIHRLIHSFKNNGANVSDINSFLKHCSDVMSDDICKNVSKLTKEQADCSLWYELRYGRITASKAYDVAHCKTLDGFLVESILGAYILKKTAAIERGRLLEPIVLSEIRKKTGIKFKKCGLILKKDLPVFGASPDGMSCDYTLEIKCPLSWKTFKTYFTSDEKPSSRCMAQVQLQMHFANKEKCIFGVAHPDFEQTKDVKIICVDYDDTYCQNLIKECAKFWSNTIFPKIYV